MFEQSVLELLKLNAGRFTSRKEIEHRLYGDDLGLLSPVSNTIQVFILRLRKKGYTIATQRGCGYRLEQ